MEMLTADYSFVNERLARHYGIPNVYGSHFRRVSLPGQTRRGLLGHGSVLTVTSYPNRTSPVLRGKWILENILGTPPPAPPADVPALDENKAGEEAKSQRERLEVHRRSAACASCHRVMDPWASRWRTSTASANGASRKRAAASIPPASWPTAAPWTAPWRSAGRWPGSPRCSCARSRRS